jgi:hypothetical protein
MQTWYTWSTVKCTTFASTVLSFFLIFISPKVGPTLISFFYDNTQKIYLQIDSLNTVLINNTM